MGYTSQKDRVKKYVEYIINNLDLEQGTKDRLSEKSECIINIIGWMDSGSERGIASAIVYISGVLIKIPLTQVRVVRAVGGTEIILRKNYKIIAEKYRKQIMEGCSNGE